jgi:hypothetical protein
MRPMAEPAMLDEAAPSKGAVEVVLGGVAPLLEGRALPVPVGYRAADVWVPLVTAYWAEAVAARAATREIMENCILDVWLGWVELVGGSRY